MREGLAEGEMRKEGAGKEKKKRKTVTLTEADKQ